MYQSLDQPISLQNFEVKAADLLTPDSTNRVGEQFNTMDPSTTRPEKDISHSFRQSQATKKDK